jgi:SAM-dependent methyltransferase
MTKQQIKDYFEGMAPSRDAWRKRNAYYHEDIKNFLRFLVPADVSVLEVGCATGDVAAFLSKENPDVRGIDFSPAMIAEGLKKYPGLDLKVEDVENLPPAERSYDYIIISDVIGYLHDIQASFSSLSEHSHAKTKIIITTYNYLWEPVFRLAEKLKLKMPHPMQNWLSGSDVEQLLYLAGFEVVKKGGRLLLPKNIPLIAPLFNKYLAKMPILKDLCLMNYFVARKRPNQSALQELSVSVLIPARNEKGNIESAVKRTPMMGKHTEILFVEGNSTDGTWEEIERVKAAYPEKDIKIMKQDGRGKGDAVRKGFDAATGDILMILDADLTVPPEDLPKFYKAMAEGDGEFINGCRLVYPMEDKAMRLLNTFGNKFFSVMFSWLLEQRIKDTLCGTKVLLKSDYRRVKAGRKFFGDFDPFGDFDLLFGASKLNLKIIDLPIRYQARVYGDTNISRFKHGWLLLKMCFFAMKKIKFI